MSTTEKPEGAPPPAQPLAGSRWKAVWDARTLDPARGSQLEQLMAADGHDTGFGNVTEASWRAFVARVGEVLALRPGDRVLEVGCGAGAFLLGWYEHGIEVAGIDQSAPLVDLARHAMPRGRFDVLEAAAIDTSARFDLVVSSGVFLYFPTHEYAREVVRRMAQMATRGIAILDLPDAAKEEAALAYRRSSAGETEYDARYVGLEHRYYDKDWLRGVLQECGLSHVRIEDQELAGYANGKFRFNAFAFKG